MGSARSIAVGQFERVETGELFADAIALTVSFGIHLKHDGEPPRAADR